MLLKSSISNTKKFFKRTVESVRSFLSGGYQRLPKNPPFQPFSCGCSDGRSLSQIYRELDKFYTDYTNQQEYDNGDANKIRSSVKGNEVCEENSTSHVEKSEEDQKKKKKKKKKVRIVFEEKRKEDLESSKGGREERRTLVREKLKELEMIDGSNVEHAMDIEEALHYYSGLTCPIYLDIVDKFLMDMYSEIFNVQASAQFKKSRTRLG